MSENQTAVEILLSQLKKSNDDGSLKVFVDTFFARQQDLAIKEIERQQIIDAGNSCATRCLLFHERLNKMNLEELEEYLRNDVLATFGEDYYEETFKST